MEDFIVDQIMEVVFVHLYGLGDGEKIEVYRKLIDVLEDDKDSLND